MARARKPNTGVVRKRRTPAQMELARRRQAAARKARLKKVHRMTPEQYESLKAFQGGLCANCRRANGNTKALAVEHDHKIAREQCDHIETESCERCWRGLACSMCNKFLGFGRDDPEFFLRFYSYLIDPPAQTWRQLADNA